jgi:hypothetical protein
MAYTAMNLQPMGKQIIARGGSTDSSSMQVYAQTAGAIGGAAICAASGAGAVAASICAQVGGAIVKVIAGNIGTPATSGNAYGLFNLWKDAMVPQARIAQEGSMAVRAYLTMRDQLIDELAQQLRPLQSVESGRAWADARLSQLGLPPAPVLPQWAPRDDLWQAYKDNQVWSKNPLGDPPTWKSSLTTPLFPTKNYCTYGEIWGYQSPSINQLRDKVGLSCSDLLLLWLYPMGAPAPPGEPINWAMVGAWELAQRFTQLSMISIPVHQASAVRVVRPGVKVTQLPYKSPQQVVTATVTPSQHATLLVLNLQEASAKLKQEVKARLASSAAVALVQLRTESDRKLTWAVAAGVLGVGAAGYWWHRRSKR